MPNLLQININREAGTGKLYLIAVLSRTLSKIAASYSKPSLLAQAAPTRVATFNINGRTIYKLLRLPVNRPFKELPPTSLTPLQQTFKNIYYLILNKKSIIRQVHLAQINCRLRQIFPRFNTKYFSRLSVLLVGNFYQLLPVGQAALYSDLPTRLLELGGYRKRAYKAIN